MEAVSLNSCAYCGTQTTQSYCCNGCEALDQKVNFGQEHRSRSHDYLDQDNFKKIYKLKFHDYDFQLYIHGLHCSSCVHIIEKLPEYDDQIVLARVDYGLSKLFIKVKTDFSLSKVISLLSDLGYPARFLRPDDSVTEFQKKENKILLKKLAVAGACAGNIMLFVIPVYSGLDGSWKLAFNWMSFLLFLPIVFYSGTSFYRAAWSGLKLRIINIDLSITVALLSGFALSTFNLIRGHEAIYFDSTASFIFLILASRYFLKRTQQKFFRPLAIEDLFNDENFLRIDNKDKSFIPLNEIKTNDLIQINTQQILPVDGQVESEAALVDVSVLNGEPLPRRFEKGMTVLAGSRVLNSPIIIKALRTPQESYVATILHQLQSGFKEKSSLISLSDRLAQGLIITVFTIALIFFVLYFNVDSQEAFNRSLALIVLACPCALALGTPLAFTLALKKAQVQGILIRSPEILEKVLKIKNIFFDKTGTLTSFNLTLMHTSPDLHDETKNIIAGLEQKSEHPIAFALREAWPDIRPAKFEKINEIPGQGVSGQFENHFYELMTSSMMIDDALKIDLKKDGHVICTLHFENLLRPESINAVNNFQKRGLNCFIVSGDRSSRVQKVAELSGISLHQAYGSLSSLEKKNIVASTTHACMIGDGTNDALALQAADVGIAVHGSTLTNMQAADIYFTRGGLNPLIELFQVARTARHVLIRNLSFSLLYNFIGGALALGGYVSPWLAALLMPISSLIIIGSTLWGLR